jgi:histidyl-tRNA synthetase
VRELRAAGLAADLPLEDRPMKAQLKLADRSGAVYAAILGERELAGGTVTVRRLADGDQQEVPIGELMAWLRAAGEAEHR